MTLNMTYYMRNNCALCSEGLLQINLALQELRNVDINLEQVNIDQDDQLQEEYMMRIPVLSHEGEVVQEGLIDFVRIYDYIEGYRGNS